jgi:hypothetical protein
VIGEKFEGQTASNLEECRRDMRASTAYLRRNLSIDTEEPGLPGLAEDLPLEREFLT